MAKDRSKWDNPKHKAKQAEYRRLVEMGQAYCTETECLMETRWIPPGSKVDAAHDESNPGEYLGPAHPKCNRSAGAHKGNAKQPVRRSFGWL